MELATIINADAESRVLLQRWEWEFTLMISVLNGFLLFIIDSRLNEPAFNNSDHNYTAKRSKSNLASQLKYVIDNYRLKRVQELFSKTEGSCYNKNIYRRLCHWSPANILRTILGIFGKFRKIAKRKWKNSQ